MRNPPPLTHIEKSAHPGVNLMTSNLISNLGWRQILLRSHTLWQTHQSLAAFLPILNSETKIIIIRKQSKEHRITGNHNVSFNNLYWKRIWIRSYGKPKQCFKKHRHHFAHKARYSQGYVFSSSHVQIWELDHKKGWAMKNWCFPTVVLEKTILSTLWTARRSNQSILKEINPEYLLEGLMLKMKFWYFGNLMWRADSLEKILMLGEIEGKRRRVVEDKMGT